jgi:outer membrane protein
MTRVSLLLITLSLLVLPAQVSAQLKIGHINTNNLIASMPEADSAQAQLQALNDELSRTGEELQVEYRKALVDYENKRDSLTALVRRTKEAALQDMMSRIQEFGNNSQIELQNRQEELFQPILVKAQNAIQSVAEEKGFDYVLDTGTGAVLTIPKDESLDILPLVQAKLGIKTE